MSDFKPILCLDFDGVIHAYTSGWKGADVIPDAAVPGAMDFIERAVRRFNVAIYSSRSGQPNGILAMRHWLELNLRRCFEEQLADEVMALVTWPTEKPPALVAIDDRAMCFTGQWPSLDELATFQPWNKKAQAAPSAVPGLHPRTADLVQRFATALAEKLADAERKYGWSTHWESPLWMDQCREQLVEHVAKGDPRDVAAYAAFLWHHGERTALPAPVAVPEGYALVPLEPTRDMRRAAVNEYEDAMDDRLPDGDGYDEEVVERLYRAMLAAAREGE